MAWEISITQDGWQEIHDELSNQRKWPKAMLIHAIADDLFEALEHSTDLDLAKLIKQIETRKKELRKLYRNNLVDIAFELIEKNNTCDNGGFAYWIDREGYHKVYLP